MNDRTSGTTQAIAPVTGSTRWVTVRASFASAAAEQSARAALERMGVDVGALPAKPGDHVLEATTDPYARPRVEGVITRSGGQLGHVRSSSPVRRDEDSI